MDPSRPEWKAFVAQMRANYGDITDRVVFADWLQEEYGDNQLSTLIRTTAEIQRIESTNWLTPFGFCNDRLPGIHKDWEIFSTARIALARTTQAHFWPPLLSLMEERPNLAAQWTFFAGFPHLVVVPYDRWTRWDGQQLPRLGPVGRVVIVDAPDCLVEIGPTAVQFTPLDNTLYTSLSKDRRTWTVERRIWNASPLPHNLREERFGNQIVANMMNEIWGHLVHKGFEVNQDYAEVMLDKHPPAT